jgi:hypothetical protein
MTKRPVLFLWIPKTAGTSIWHQFEWTRKPTRRVPPRQFDPSAHFTTFQHVPIQSVLNAGVVSREWVDSAIKIAVVRNPWERLVSIYHSLRQSGRRLAGMTFGDYVQHATSDEYPAPHHSAIIDAPYASPQTTWLVLGGRMISNITLVHENLRQGWGWLCQEIGLEPTILPRLNASKHGDYKEYYSDETRELVARRYAEEIAMFEYEFEI